MTKQQPCATRLSPSRLCRLLLIAFALKLFVLGMLILDPAMTGGTFAFSFSSKKSAGQIVGAAAAAEGPAAPPALEATLPDAGMDRPVPGRPGSSGAPVASSGVASPLGGLDPDRALPAITAPASTPQQGISQNDVRDALTRRQEDLSRKEQELRVLESELSSRLEKMKMLENRLASMIKDAEETKDAKFRHLVDVLSNMKAKQAAAVLETLDPKIAVRVLAGMRGRQAGDILTFVKPEIAAHLTESLARMQLPLE
jgi:flagellar motility protein MotE (MotC chaperone)